MQAYLSAEIMSENCELVDPSSRWSLDLIGPLTYMRLIVSMCSGSCVSGWGTAPNLGPLEAADYGAPSASTPRLCHSTQPNSQVTPNGQRADRNQRHSARAVNSASVVVVGSGVRDRARADQAGVTEPPTHAPIAMNS